jgi:hypothetical protein
MRIHLLCLSGVHDWFGSLLECQCVVRPVSQRRLNLFAINKVRINGLVISHLYGFTTILAPLPFFWVFFISSILIIQMVNTRNRVAANNAENMARATTKKPTSRHPLRLLLRKCWLCKHRCFRPCNRPWSTFMHNPKHHRSWGIGWKIFSALSHQPFLMLWSRWMLMIGSSLLRRSWKWYSATIVRRSC